MYANLFLLLICVHQYDLGTECTKFARCWFETRTALYTYSDFKKNTNPSCRAYEPTHPYPSAWYEIRTTSVRYLDIRTISVRYPSVIKSCGMTAARHPHNWTYGISTGGMQGGCVPAHTALEPTRPRPSAVPRRTSPVRPYGVRTASSEGTSAVHPKPADVRITPL